MISTEFYYGQGLGNQLACYVTTRVIATDKGYDFGFSGIENFGDRRFNSSGLYFMNLDLGKPVQGIVNRYVEKELRLKMNSSHHDMTLGCDIRGIDLDLINVPDNTKIDGVMQGEGYFYHRKEDLKKWLKVKEEYEVFDFSSDDICVLNYRDYSGPDSQAMYLSRNYWVQAIYNMLKINPDFTFVVITENPDEARNVLPELDGNIFHFDVGRDYSIIKNAKYLILSNSSFAIWPIVTGNPRMVIAPMYWGRHNVSDGFWTCGYNLYHDWFYQDRDGFLFSYDECKRNLDLYMKNNPQIYNK